MRLDDLLPLHMKLRSVLSSGKRLNHAEPAKPTDTLKARYTNLLLENEVWMPLSRRGWEDLCMLRSQISLCWPAEALEEEAQSLSPIHRRPLGPSMRAGPGFAGPEMRGVDSNQSQAILRHFAAAPREPGEASLGPLRC